MRCNFCGQEFNETEAVKACAGCPLHYGCGKTKCPHCGFEAIQTPRWLRWLSRTKSAAHLSEDRTCALASMKAGERGIITDLEGADQGTVRKLMAMGLVPGTELGVVRSKPGVILKIGFSEVALDREAAAKVIVEVLADKGLGS